MSKQLEKFISLLEEMFQFDQADLDFGIYRIMNQKREEIQSFLKNDLVPQVNQAFEKFKGYEVELIKQQLEQLEKQLLDMGVAKESSEKYQSLSAKLSQSVDTIALENEVYSHLTNFFKRYYSEGDFISQRRYKKDVYAIPYEGEEVKLHWANADQYYIKSSEQFKDYSFTLPSGKKVHFKLVEASTEQNNNKSQSDKERRFILASENPTVEEDGELIIRFEYRIHENNKKREVINKETIETINSQHHLIEWINELNETVSGKAFTILEKHLNEYTARHTFDYFIHKNLGEFLRRELDFFIKNEIMFLDDLDTENEKKFEQYLSKVKVIKSIGSKVIEFLAQLENFQKKLYLKKKFVVDTNYCITLNLIPEDFYPEIVVNKLQIDEWIKLFNIDEIPETLTTIGYSENLSVEFLKQNKYLVLDTKNFNKNFTNKLLSTFNNIDSSIKGILVNSDNSQALNLLREKYREKIRAVYIDPPYNTVHSEILYKNQFKNSSWLALMSNVANLTKPYFEKVFSFGIAIDDFEVINLTAAYDTIFPSLERNIVVINHHPQGAGGRLSRTHEYFVLYSPSQAPAFLGEPLEDYEEDRSFMRSGTAENNFRSGRWNSFYALLVNPKTNEIVGAEPPVPLDEEYPLGLTEEGYKRIYPINSRNEERVWRSSYKTGLKRAKDRELVLSDGGTVYQKINHESKRETLFSNWTDTKFNAGTNGTNLLNSMGLGGLFDYPKSIYTVETALWAQTYGDKECFVMDYFGGSGTTAHAVINLNRKDNGDRKFIIVEMGEYFNTVTKPRTMKAIYSKDWKNGKPVSREGSSSMIKYIRLESYEDSLNNIELKQSEQQILAMNEYMSPEAREEYMLSYMLGVEAANSPTLLNIDMFTNPFNYKMKINNGTESKVQSVDLVETFNYLLGLHVETVDFIQGCQLIKGYFENGYKVLVIWRNIEELSNDKLNDLLKTLDINSRDFEYDRIYVNGDNHIENLRLGDSTWKVRLIEEEFKKLMFDVNDI